MPRLKLPKTVDSAQPSVANFASKSDGEKFAPKKRDAPSISAEDKQPEKVCVAYVIACVKMMCCRNEK